MRRPDLPQVTEADRLVPWRMARRSGRWLAAGDEHVFPAVVAERFSGEAAVECLDLQARDIDESEPLVLGGPPHRTRCAAVEGDVDPVVAYRIPVGVRHWLVLVLAVQPRGDVVVEGKGIPGETSSRPKRGGDPVKGAAAVGPGRQVQQRPERAV